MDLLEAIYTRRSIRKFTDEPVGDEKIHTLLKCAMLAPSACNQQPWHFLVITEKAIREKVSRASPYCHMAANAPLVIIVCGDTINEKAPGFWVQDCSAATENLLLAARDLELGSVWCGIYNEEDRVTAIRNIFHLPDGIIPLNLICIGYPATGFKPEDRFDSKKVHFEKW